MPKALIHFSGYSFSAIGAIIGVSILSHYISPEEYGRVALYVVLATLFQNIIRESLGNWILRHSYYFKQINKKFYLPPKTTLTLFTAYTFIVFTGFLWIGKSAAWSEFFYGAIFIGFLGWTIIGESLLSAQQHRVAYAVHSNILQWGRFLFASLLYIFYEQTVSSVMLGFACGSGLTILFDIVIISKTQQQNETILPSRSQLPSLKLNTSILIGVLIWFTSFYDRIALEWFQGEGVLGVYFLLFQIGFMPIMLGMRVSFQYLLPILFAENNENSAKQAVEKNTKLIIFILIAGGIAFFSSYLLSSWLFSWLVGVEFRDYHKLLPWVVLAAVLSATSYFMQINFYANSNMQNLLIVRFINMISCFVLVTFGAWYGSIIGVVYANVIVSVISILASLWQQNKCDPLVSRIVK